MARTPKNLDIRTIATTSLTTIYPAPAGINTTISVLSFTNKTSTAISISIFHNDGSADFLQKIMTLPAGNGRERIAHGMQRRTINSGDSIKIQADSANAFVSTLSGSEVEI